MDLRMISKLSTALEVQRAAPRVRAAIVPSEHEDTLLRLLDAVSAAPSEASLRTTLAFYRAAIEACPEFTQAWPSQTTLAWGYAHTLLLVEVAAPWRPHRPDRDDSEDRDAYAAFPPPPPPSVRVTDPFVVQRLVNMYCDLEYGPWRRAHLYAGARSAMCPETKEWAGAGSLELLPGGELGLYAPNPYMLQRTATTDGRYMRRVKDAANDRYADRLQRLVADGGDMYAFALVALREVDAWAQIGAQGVESLEDACYLNMGDTYAPTLIFSWDPVRGHPRFHAATMGDWLGD